RQRKDVDVSWPVNRIVEIRSEKGLLSASRLITIPTNAYKYVNFEVGAVESKFSYDISAKGVSKAYLLLPKHDVVAVDFSSGSVISKPIMQRGEPVGV